MTDAVPSLTLLERDIREARRALPAQHAKLLEQLNVQEDLVTDWPGRVLDLYRTLGETPPAAAAVSRVAAVWLDARSTIAFNAPYLAAAAAGLDPSSRYRMVAAIAWHEYGHALSLARASREHRALGPELVELLPGPLRKVVAEDEYRRAQLFDEVVATIYALMVDRIRDHGYRAPEFLHPRVFATFQEVIPWPPTT